MSNNINSKMFNTNRPCFTYTSSCSLLNIDIQADIVIIVMILRY